MKKILFFTLVLAFAVSPGVSYGDVTDVSGLNYDIGIAPAEAPAQFMEGVHAGGLRESGPGLIMDNGVTDFSGKTYEDSNLTIAPSAIEGVHAGGMREEKPAKDILSGVTDFSGKTYD